MLGWIDDPDHTVATKCVVLVPSLGTTSQLFDALATDIGHALPRLSVVRVDLPGHGVGPRAQEVSVGALAEEIIQRTRSISEDGLWVVGVSLGGAIALEVARQRPSTLRGFGMINSGSRFGTPRGWRELIDRVQREGTAGLRSGSASGWFSEKHSRSATARALLDELDSIDPTSYIACCRALEAYRGDENVKAVVAAGLLIGTADDRATPASGMRELAGLLPNADYVELPGGGHLSLLEHRAVVGSLVTHWLGEGSQP